MLPRAGSVCCPQMLAMYQHLTEQKKGTNTTEKKKGKKPKLSTLMSQAFL